MFIQVPSLPWRSHWNLTALVLVSAVLLLALLGCQAASTPAPTPTATKAPAAPAAPTATVAPTATRPPAPTSTPAPKDEVTMRLDFLPTGKTSPFYVALDKGYYDQARLTVKIGEGKGSVTTAQQVASKNDTFGFVDGPVLIKAVASGAPIKMISCILIKNGMGLNILDDSGITKPKDLEGKKIGLSPGAATLTLLPPFLAANNVDASKVTVVNMDVAATDAALMQKKVDAASSFIGGNDVRVTAQGFPARTMVYADWGLKIIGQGIVAHNDTIKEKPDMVKRFLAATYKGWEDARKNPKEAVDIIRKYVPEIPAEPNMKTLEAALSLTSLPETKGKPLGWMPREYWESSVDMLVKYDKLEPKPSVDSLFTNDLIPTQ